MISTVTTTVVSVVSTAASGYLVTSLGLAAVVTLLVALVGKEMVSAGASSGFRAFGRNLNVPIVALLFVFVFIAVSRVIEALA